MKQLTFSLLLLLTINFSCRTTGTLTAIEPKAGTMELPAKGEYRMWRNIEHPGFLVTLINPSATQSCEVYKVTANGNEKWISPSLMAGKKVTLSIPENGHLFLKNFNENVLKIEYQVKE
jgi:hypothetical protein